MAKKHGKEVTSVNYDDSGGVPVNIKDFVETFDFPQVAELHETSGVGDADKEQSAGQKGGADIAISGFFGSAASEPDILFQSAVGSNTTRTFSFTEGVVTYSVETLLADYRASVAKNAMISFSATLRMTGAITRT